MIRTVIAAGDVAAKADPWMQRRTFERMSAIFRKCPGADRGTAERPPLKHGFVVVVPSARALPDMGSEGLPNFPARPFVEDGQLLIEAQVIHSDEGDLPERLWRDEARSPERLGMVGDIVENTMPRSNQAKRCRV